MLSKVKSITLNGLDGNLVEIQTDISNGIPEFDINTILKIKKIMDSLNTSNKDDPRANLLLSLKPYLNETKKDKIDNYVKFLQFAKIIEVMNPLGGDEVKDE